MKKHKPFAPALVQKTEGRAAIAHRAFQWARWLGVPVELSDDMEGDVLETAQREGLRGFAFQRLLWHAFAWLLLVAIREKGTIARLEGGATTRVGVGSVGGMSTDYVSFQTFEDGSSQADCYRCRTRSSRLTPGPTWKASIAGWFFATLTNKASGTTKGAVFCPSCAPKARADASANARGWNRN